MEKMQETAKIETIPLQTEKHQTSTKKVMSVPDNCANCPDSSCCRHASDRFHGKAGYEDE